MSYPDRFIAAPTELTGCTLWLDSSDVASITKDVSNIVSAWNDKSGLGNHFAQATAGSRPTYTVNGIDFDGVDEFLIGPAASSVIALGAGTMLCVFKVDAISSNAGNTYQNDALIGNTSAALFGIHLKSTPPTVFAYNWDGTDDAVAGAVALGRRAITTWRHGGGVLDGRVNRVSQGAIPSGNTTGLTAVVEIARGASAEYFDGQILEVVAYSRALSDGEVALVEAYLAKKYAILPSRAVASPLEIPDCKLWLDAAVGVTQAGGLVSQWDDQSGNANHFTQATAGNKPTYQATSGPRGGPAILFDGVDDEMDATSNISNPSGQSVFAVVNLVTAVTTRGVIIATREWLFQTHCPTLPTGPSITGSAGDAAIWPILGKGYKAVSEVNSTSLAVLRIDGDTANGPVIGAGTRTTTAIGRDPSLTTRVANMQLVELLVYNRMVSDGERVLIERYLERKYGLGVLRLISTPLAISSCTLWLDSTDLATITKDGANLVSQWNDKSGLGNNVTQGTLTNRPLYTASGIDFDGVDNYFTGPAISALFTASEHTFFCVFVADAIDTTGGGATVYNNDGLIADGAAFVGMHLRTSSGQPQVVAYNWDGNADSATADILLGQRTVVAQVHGGTRLGITSGSTHGQTTSGNTTNLTNLLMLGRSNAGNYFDGKILEVVVFSRALSDGERGLVERYLSAKYSL